MARALVLDDNTRIKLEAGPNNTLTAKVPIQKDGMYHVSAIEGGEDVRLSEDYFIEAMKDNPPEVKITRPGRDFRASPIEEVTVTVDAKDDFGLKDVLLHYSVNGGAEKTVPLLSAQNAKQSTGSTTIALEDFKLEPGDLVSVYATAKDARNISKTDMFFIEAQPFERNYSQSQQGGGGGGGGGGDDQDPSTQISQRQKEIITATWNQAKGKGARGTDAENAAFLSGVQSKLRDQAQSLAQRMKSRELDEAGDAFKSFVSDMEQAVTAMGPAVDHLKNGKWQDSIAPEQQALKFLLRGHATRRYIQSAFGQQQGGGGGGGGGGATRDLEGLFDLELDTEKNQYEGPQSNQSADAQQRAVDQAMDKLKELARRQQELAEQQKKGPQTSQQRWEQEMLRREAEQLRQQLEQVRSRHAAGPDEPQRPAGSAAAARPTAGSATRAAAGWATIGPAAGRTAIRTAARWPAEWAATGRPAVRAAARWATARRAAGRTPAEPAAATARPDGAGWPAAGQPAAQRQFRHSSAHTRRADPELAGHA